MKWDRDGSVSYEGGGNWSPEWIKKNQSGFEIVYEALPRDVCLSYAEPFHCGCA